MPLESDLSALRWAAWLRFGSLTRYHWIKAAVSLMGMPQYEKYILWQLEMLKKQGLKMPLQQWEVDALLEKLKLVDLSKQPEALDNRPLLFWHGRRGSDCPLLSLIRMIFMRK